RLLTMGHGQRTRARRRASVPPRPRVRAARRHRRGRAGGLPSRGARGTGRARGAGSGRGGGGTVNAFRSPLAPDANAGRVALATGGGTGIGRGTARELARTDAPVALCRGRPAPLEAGSAEPQAAGAGCLAIPADVRR